MVLAERRNGVELLGEVVAYDVASESGRVVVSERIWVARRTVARMIVQGRGHEELLANAEEFVPTRRV